MKKIIVWVIIAVSIVFFFLPKKAVAKVLTDYLETLQKEYGLRPEFLRAVWRDRSPLNEQLLTYIAYRDAFTLEDNDTNKLAWKESFKTTESQQRSVAAVLAKCMSYAKQNERTAVSYFYFGVGNVQGGKVNSTQIDSVMKRLGL